MLPLRYLKPRVGTKGAKSRTVPVTFFWRALILIAVPLYFVHVLHLYTEVQCINKFSLKRSLDIFRKGSQISHDFDIFRIPGYFTGYGHPLSNFSEETLEQRQRFYILYE